MNLRTITSAPARAFRARSLTANRPPVSGRRPALYLAVASAGAVLVSVLSPGEPAADAAQLDSVSVAEQLGISAQQAPSAGTDLGTLEDLAASRSERDAERAAAAAVQEAAVQAEL